MDINTKREQHNSVVTDGEEERGEHPVGKVCHISTVTHAWRGTLLAVTPSYYVFDPSKEIALVDSTGDMGSYFSAMTVVRDGDLYKPTKKTEGKNPTIRVLRAAVSWMVSEA